MSTLDRASVPSRGGCVQDRARCPGYVPVHAQVLTARCTVRAKRQRSREPSRPCLGDVLGASTARVGLVGPGPLYPHRILAFLETGSPPVRLKRSGISARRRNPRVQAGILIRRAGLPTYLHRDYPDTVRDHFGSVQNSGDADHSERRPSELRCVAVIFTALLRRMTVRSRGVLGASTDPCLPVRPLAAARAATTERSA